MIRLSKGSFVSFVSVCIYRYSDSWDMPSPPHLIFSSNFMSIIIFASSLMVEFFLNPWIQNMKVSWAFHSIVSIAWTKKKNQTQNFPISFSLSPLPSLLTWEAVININYYSNRCMCKFPATLFQCSFSFQNSYFMSRHLVTKIPIEIFIFISKRYAVSIILPLKLDNLIWLDIDL